MTDAVPCPSCGKTPEATAFRCVTCGYERGKYIPTAAWSVALGVLALLCTLGTIGNAATQAGGIAAQATFSALLGVATVILAHTARRELKRKPDKRGRRSMLFGMWAGYISIAVSLTIPATGNYPAKLSCQSGGYSPEYCDRNT